MVAVTAPAWVFVSVVQPEVPSVPPVPGTKPLLPVGLCGWGCRVYCVLCVLRDAAIQDTVLLATHLPFNGSDCGCHPRRG